MAALVARLVCLMQVAAAVASKAAKLIVVSHGMHIKNKDVWQADSDTPLWL
jgi:hypothetical protein